MKPRIWRDHGTPFPGKPWAASFRPGQVYYMRTHAQALGLVGDVLTARHRFALGA